MSSTTISVIALIASIVMPLIVWFVSYNFYQKKRLYHARATNLVAIVPIERSLGDIQSAFRFHGITDQDFKEAGVTPQELAYLVASFTAGRIYDDQARSESFMKEPYNESHYRYKMLAQHSTRRAWPLIARMMTADEYIEKLEITKDAIENGVRVGNIWKTQLKFQWPIKRVYVP